MTRHSIREFIQNLSSHLRHLMEYLVQVKNEKAFKENFNQISLSKEFLDFKEIFSKSKGSGLSALKAEEFFLSQFEKIGDSYVLTIDGVIKILEDKILEIKAINLKGQH